MSGEIDSIPIFKPCQVLELNDAKVSSIDHANKKQYVVGDSKGVLTLYQIGKDNNSSTPVGDPIRLGKSKVTKLACLSTNNLMVAAIMDSNLYVANFANGTQELILKNAINFSYWQGEQGKPKIFVMAKNKCCAYKLNFDAQSLQGVFELEKVRLD